MGLVTTYWVELILTLQHYSNLQGDQEHNDLTNTASEIKKSHVAYMFLYVVVLGLLLIMVKRIIRVPVVLIPYQSAKNTRILS